MKNMFPKTEMSLIDDIVYTWICQMRSKLMPASGPLIQQKALEVAAANGNGNLSFTASN